MIETSDKIGTLAGAMMKVQAAVSGVSKDSANPHFRSRYASLESVVAAVRDHYLDAGLVVMQAPGQVVDGCQTLTTLIVHGESGEWLKNTAQIPLGKNDPQGAGSALTYIERYSLMALFNLPPVDDDGEAATTHQAPRQSAPRSKAVEPAPPPPSSGPIVSSAMRKRLQNDMGRRESRKALKLWSELVPVREAIEDLTDNDQAMFEIEYRKKWESLPEDQAITAAG